MSEDNASEVTNVIAMMLSMVSILMKIKWLAWVGILVASVSYVNAHSSQDGQQLLSSFMLAISSLVMCYLTSPAPIAAQLASQLANKEHAGGS